MDSLILVPLGCDLHLVAIYETLFSEFNVSMKFADWEI